MDLIEIARGWFEFARATDYTKQLMEKRLAICDTCPHKKQINSVGSAIINLINEGANTFKCGKCGCPLSALTSNPNMSCSAGKWERAGEQSYY